MTIGLWRAVLLALIVLGSPLVCAAAVALSDEQLQWIALQPVLRVGVVEGLIPFEYMNGGEPVSYTHLTLPTSGLV